MNKIIELEKTNRLLTVEIAQLNTGNQTRQEQNRIDENFQIIEINNLEILRLRALNDDEANE